MAPPVVISEPQRINLSWLVTLRFSAILGQVITILLVDRVMGISLPLILLFSIIAVELFTNLLCTSYARSGRPVRPFMLPLIMALDVLLLTGLLYLTGGAFNPFSILYLVQIALAAVVLPPRPTWFLVVLSVACSGVLFMVHRPLPLLAGSHDENMNMHLRGMWVAFSVAASFIVYFLFRVTRALARREDELAQAQKLAARQEKLASLATLAAGAAHELATPLSTIALVARELERQLPLTASAAPQGPDLVAALEDVRLIRQQVERCRGVLDQMAADAGESAGENISESDVSELLHKAAEALPKGRVRIEISDEAARLRLPLPRRALLQSLRGLLKNALDASAGPGERQDVPDILLGARVVRPDGAAPGDGRRALRIEVRDHGAGMDKDVLARAGEPFFTTKSPGHGMGLGLFLARAVVERLGGELHLLSVPAKGTQVVLSLPLGPLLTGATIRRMADAGEAGVASPKGLNE